MRRSTGLYTILIVAMVYICKLIDTIEPLEVFISLIVLKIGCDVLLPEENKYK